MNDPVNNPKHYKLFPDMEAIEVIRRTLSYQEYIGYLKGNALKYRLRAGDKGDTQQDIDKSNWYRKALRDVLPNEGAQAVSADVTPEVGESLPVIPKGGKTVIRKGLPENYFKALDAFKKMPEVTPEEDEAWDEKRIDIVGSNGNDGLHYSEVSE